MDAENLKKSSTVLSQHQPNLWPAPAKLNLFLQITGRRDDGYHQLQTLFQILDYGDTLTFNIRDDNQVRRANAIQGVDESTDLTVRAAQLLKTHTGCDLGVDISVDKRIPMGGGLGGGSSDAATTLVALNHLWKLNLSLEELSNLGVSLGADVPVFVWGETAWGEGVGEQLTPLELQEKWFLVVTPNVFVSTGDLFAVPELTRDARPIKIRDYLAAGVTGVENNVFETIVRRRYAVIDRAMNWLTEATGTQARMTGTGSSIYVAFDSEAQAASIKAQVPGDWQSFCAQGRNQSPLKNKLSSLS